MDSLQRWYSRFIHVALKPSRAIENREEARRVHMVMLVSSLTIFVSAVISIYYLITDAPVPMPLVTQFFLFLFTLSLIYAGRVKFALRFLVPIYVFSHLIAVFFTGLNNLFYVVSSFTVISVLIDNMRLRLFYSALLIAATLVVAGLSSTFLESTAVPAGKVLMFTVFGLLTVVISTSVVDGDLKQIRQQMRTLHESEQRYRLITDHISDMVALHDLDGRYLYANPAYLRATGFTEQDLNALKKHEWLMIMHPEDQQYMLSAAFLLLKEGKELTKLNYRHQRKDGSYFWAETYSAPVYDQTGNIVQFVSSTRDISERMKMEEALRSSQAQLAEAQQITHLGSWHWDTLTNTVSWSDEMYRIFGLPRRQTTMTYAEYLSVIHPNERDIVDQIVMQAYETHSPYSMYHRIVHPEKGERIIHGLGRVVVNAEGKVSHMFGTTQDVTEAKRAEQALSTRNKYLTAMHRITLDLLNHKEMDDLLQAVVENAAHILDMPYAKLTLLEGDVLAVRAYTTNMAYWAHSRLDRAAAPQLWQAHDSLQPIILTDSTLWEGKCPFFTGIKAKILVAFPITIGTTCIGVLEVARSEPGIHFADEHIEIGMTLSRLAALVVDSASQYKAALQEIAERKRVEAALRESEQRATTLLNALPDLVIRFNKKAEVISIAGNIDFAAAPPDQVLGRSLVDARDWGSDHENVEKINNTGITLIRKAQEEKKLQIMEYQLATPEKGLQDFELRLIADADDEVTAVIRDITERKTAERKQRQLTDELQAVNQQLQQFAYIVSHDLKAPLRGMMSITSWLASDYEAHLDDEGRQMLSLLNNRARRMDAMINGILEYSRLAKPVPLKALDLNALVSETIEELGATTAHSISIETPLPIIIGDSTRMREVFQNLIDNAIKYMDKPAGIVVVGCQRKDNAWQFSVRDNGPGIEKQHFERIFQMFQTLHPRDVIESTGIGLTIVKRIVELYGGKIWLESTLGSGSTFYFTLPITEPTYEHE